MAKPKLTTECIDCFCEVVAFQTLSPEDIDLLNAHRVELKFNKGEVICKQGSFATHLLFVQKGLTKSYLEEESRTQIICLNPPGSFLEIPSLTVDNVFHYTVTALEDVEVCFFDLQIIKDIMQSNAKFACQLMKIGHEALVLIYDRFFSLTQKQLHGRMADVLLCLSNRIYGSYDFILDFSRKDLADLTAMSNESAIRILKDFKDDNIIETEGKGIKIINLEMLRKISRFG
ncbi:MAG: Crp/Fnr family transcriptional regulator [Bacteroidales bacterium]|jgi:CRP-like cAMP-binding protein|nr:Crp/Fnr family transcriptional regulator [Bacteroidales bacterium]